MRPLLRTLCLLAGLGSAAAVHAGTVQGRLELTWGDPADGYGHAVLVATLVTDAGVRLPLDPDRALAAAEDLHALAGRRVAVEFSPTAKSTGRGQAATVIVPADLQPQAVLGTTVWVTLMCKFSDVATEQQPQSFFQGQYGNAQGQLDHYWREVSHGKINLTGSSAHGWYTLPQPRSYYVPAEGSADLGQLFTDCTAAADAEVDFAAGGGVQGINMMFNDNLDGYAWGGSRCTTLDGLDKCYSSTWNPPWAFSNLAPLAHEMGHGYGLPHANNSDDDADPYDNPWDVMSDAWSNAATSPTYGSVAKHLNTYHRDRLGWIDAARKLELTAGSEAVAIQLDRASLAGSSQRQLIVVRVPGEPASRYYTIEVRKRSGYYEADLAGNAVIIHRVDTGRGEPAWSVDASVPPADRANNEGSMFKAGEYWVAPADAFRVRVLAENGDGFVVSVCRGWALGQRVSPCNLAAAGTVVRNRTRVPGPVPTLRPCGGPLRHCSPAP